MVVLKDNNGNVVKPGNYVKMNNEDVYCFMGSYESQDDVPEINRILYFIGDHLYIRKVDRSLRNRLKTRFRRIIYRLSPKPKFCTHL